MYRKFESAKLSRVHIISKIYKISNDIILILFSKI